MTFIPSVTPERVAEQIGEVFKREAEVDARYIRVEVADHTARLFGHVHSLTEASTASAAAAAAPGVAKVDVGQSRAVSVTFIGWSRSPATQMARGPRSRA
jgi:hypothetical protein